MHHDRHLLFGVLVVRGNLLHQSHSLHHHTHLRLEVQEGMESQLLHQVSLEVPGREIISEFYHNGVPLQ